MRNEHGCDGQNGKIIVTTRGGEVGDYSYSFVYFHANKINYPDCKIKDLVAKKITDVEIWPLRKSVLYDNACVAILTIECVDFQLFWLNVETEPVSELEELKRRVEALEKKGLA